MTCKTHTLAQMQKMKVTSTAISWDKLPDRPAGCTASFRRLERVLKSLFVSERGETAWELIGQVFVRDTGPIIAAGAVPDTVPREVLADCEEPLSLLPGFVVLDRTGKYPPFGWVSTSVPVELATNIRRLLDPDSTVNWNIAPDWGGVMTKYP